MSWSAASEYALAASLDAVQHAPCSYVLPHACLGGCRNGGAAPKVFLPDDASLTLQHSSDDNNGLARLVRHAPGCAITFAGDSVTHDSWLAAMAGVLRLGWRLDHCTWRTPSCKSGPSRCVNGTAMMGDGESEPFCKPATPGMTEDVAVFLPPLAGKQRGKHKDRGGGGQRTRVSVEAQGSASPPSAQGASCESLTLRRVQLKDLNKNMEQRLYIIAREGLVIMNEGLWANRPAELTKLLDEHVKPLFDMRQLLLGGPPANESPDFPMPATILWRETTPQHFGGSSGTGLFAERKGSAGTGTRGKKEGAISCAAVNVSDAEHVHKAGWRNHLFEKWSRPWRGAKARRHPKDPTVRIVPAFDALLPRHDLHVAPDCTHFCFSPFLWQPVWTAAADVLDDVLAGKPEKKRREAA